jgi:DNA helicase HerA-like ATPase
MGPLGRKNEAIPAFVFPEPAAEEFFTSMTPAGDPFGIYLGGVQDVASRIDVAIDNCLGHRIFHHGTKLRCSKAEY